MRAAIDQYPFVSMVGRGLDLADDRTLSSLELLLDLSETFEQDQIIIFRP